MIVLHEEADEHAPFKHYIISNSEIVRKRVPNLEGKRPRVESVTISSFYVVCYYCGHWIERKVAKCNCVASCHVITETNDPGTSVHAYRAGLPTLGKR